MNYTCHAAAVTASAQTDTSLIVKSGVIYSTYSLSGPFQSFQLGKKKSGRRYCSHSKQRTNEIALHSIKSMNSQNHKVVAISSKISSLLSYKAAFCPPPPNLDSLILDSLLDELQSTSVQCSEQCFYSCSDDKLTQRQMFPTQKNITWGILGIWNKSTFGLVNYQKHNWQMMMEKKWVRQGGVMTAVPHRTNICSSFLIPPTGKMNSIYPIYVSGSSWPKSALGYISNVLMQSSWAEQQPRICGFIAQAQKWDK